MWSLGGFELNWLVKFDNVALIGWIGLITLPCGLSKVFKLFPLFVDSRSNSTVGLDWLVRFENTVGLILQDRFWSWETSLKDDSSLVGSGAKPSIDDKGIDG